LRKGEYAEDEMFIKNTFGSKMMKHFRKLFKQLVILELFLKEDGASPKIKTNDLEAVKKK